MTDHELDARAVAGVDHPVGLCDAGGHRLLAKNMKPRCSGRLSLLGVKEFRSTDINEVEVTASQELVVIGVVRLCAELSGGALGVFDADIGDCDELDLVTKPANSRKVRAKRDRSGSDQADPQFRVTCHRSEPPRPIVDRVAIISDPRTLGA